MTKPTPANEVYDQACAWAARADAGALTLEEQAALDLWLDTDSRHFGAFAQATALLQPVDREIAAERREPPRGLGHRRRAIGMAAAASIALLAFTGWSISLFWQNRTATMVGEVRLIPLADGSTVSLNTDSTVIVNYSATQRGIELVKGEALFDVAKDAARPFIVKAGDTEVRAVGTSFTVRMLPSEPVQVLVREGVVEVLHPDVAVAPPVRVAENSRAFVPANAPITAKPVESAEVTRELAWREGHVSFHGETLGEAAGEFARYSHVRIRIDDPAIARQKVTGLFVAADPVGFSKAVATSFGLHADIEEKEIRLTR